MTKRLVAASAVGLLITSGFAAPAPGADARPAEQAASVEVPADLNLAGPGLARVVVWTTDSLNAAAVDPATLTVGDGSVPEVAVARHADGNLLASPSDVDGDGRDDLVFHVDKQKLIDDTDLTVAGAELAVLGKLMDGHTIRGTDTVTPNVTLEIKFREALEVRGANQRLHSEQGAGLERVRAVLNRHSAEEIEPLVQSMTPLELDRVASEAQARSGQRAPDMASWYSLTLRADANVDQAVGELESLPEVIHAYPAPDLAPPPASSTPDFTDMQGYFRPAPEGIDADFSRQDPRLRGSGIKIVDLEYNWNPFHEDLQLDWSSDVGGDVFPRYTGFADEHGTAVFGEMVAVENDYGITGGVPDAEIYGISPTRRVSSTQTRWLPGEALAYLAGIDNGKFLKPGDAVLLEQQTTGPNYDPEDCANCYAPLEWIPSVFDATQLLTGLGVSVVSTGGNGNQNVDGPEYEGRFDRNVRDSGAIMVGAGSSTTHERLGFSNYGSRFDLQGWGHNIVTTGGNGNLQGGTDPANVNFRYTRTFGGTSGAGPIVTSAVVAIQSYLKATGQGVWSAAEIANVLEQTGTPQGGETSEHVGPLPDLEAALKQIEVDPPTTTILLDGQPPRPGSYVDPVVTFVVDDGWGSGAERTRYRIDSRGWQTYKGPFSISGHGKHKIEYRSKDVNRNAERVRSLTFKNSG